MKCNQCKTFKNNKYFLHFFFQAIDWSKVTAFDKYFEVFDDGTTIGIQLKTSLLNILDCVSINCYYFVKSWIINECIGPNSKVTLLYPSDSGTFKQAKSRTCKWLLHIHHTESIIWNKLTKEQFGWHGIFLNFFSGPSRSGVIRKYSRKLESYLFWWHSIRYYCKILWD